MSRIAVPSPVSEGLGRLGFDVAVIPGALRTACAACLALWLGWLLGLDHPQWSAMTVWAASQPLRGQIVEKSFFRMVGTIIGVIAGVGFLTASGEDVFSLVMVVSIWTALCATLGNLHRGYLSYGVTLAGYSAAMVALLDFERPTQIAALATDRLLTVLLGVVVAMVVGLLFAPRRADGAVIERTRNLSIRLFRALADDLRGETFEDRKADVLLAEAGFIEEMLDPQSPGSLDDRRQARALARALSAQVAALLWLRRSQARKPGDRRPAAAQALDDAAEAFESGRPSAQALALLQKAHDAVVHDPTLSLVLRDLHATLQDSLDRSRRRPEHRPPAPHLRHRDWLGAKEAGVRALSVMLFMGAVWLISGSNVGPYLMLGAAVMTTVFSSVDFPARTIGFVFRGTALGVAAALICRWLVWPWAGSSLDLVLLSMPFILAGPFVMAHRRTGEGAFDYNMHLLLLLAPAFPLTDDVGRSLGVALAVLAGPAAAWIGYSFVYPATLSRRLDHMTLIMIRDIEKLAVRPSSGRLKIWRARLPHRMLRLSRLIEKTGRREISSIRSGIIVLALAETAVALRGLVDAPSLTVKTRSRARHALASLKRLSGDPGAAAVALKHAANSLPAGHVQDASLLMEAVDAATQIQTGALPCRPKATDRP